MWSRLRRSAAFWFGLTFLIAAGSMLPLVLNEKATYEALQAEGQPTQAAVVDSSEYADADEKNAYWLKLQYYDFELNEYVKEQTVSKAIWEQYPVGTTIPVRYLRQTPQTVKLESSLPKPEWKDLLALTITFLAIGLAIVTLASIKARRAAGGHLTSARERVVSVS